VRDLAWACFSQSLLHIDQVGGLSTAVSSCTPDLTPEREQWLQQLDDDPAALIQHLSVRPTHRLGIYFEQLWHFFLQEDPGYDLIARNLPVHDAGRTLGEFDCIAYSHQQQRHIHLELAVKFFLGVPQNPERTQNGQIEGNAHDWLGPDRKDRLETKQKQLLQRQIMLGETPAAKKVLADLGIIDSAKEIALKGYLFQPLSSPLPPPPGYNRACPFSVWVTLEELGSHCDALAASAFVVLPKWRWLSPAQNDAPEDRLDPHQLQRAIALALDDDQYPPLIAALDGTGTESSRFFVTPQNWPQDSQR
jgi:uncharacterized protein